MTGTPADQTRSENADSVTDDAAEAAYVRAVHVVMRALGTSLGQIFDSERGPATVDRFLRGEAIFVVTRDEVQVRYPDDSAPDEPTGPTGNYL